MNPIRVLIADDHTLLRDALAELLQAKEGIEVVATAADVAETLRRTAETRPHLVLLDVEMPGNEQPALTVRRLRALSPAPQILILSMHDDPAIIQSLLAAGVRGFLHKAVTHQALEAAVHDACTPGSQVTLSLSAHGMAGPGEGGFPVLSQREIQVVELAAHGRSNQQIARRLGIAEATVKRHMRNIFDKLQARSRVEAANRAVEQGFIQAPAATAVHHALRRPARPVML
ncbi:response regulator transcription factor [Streptomyces xanthochromogenes]|uniref:response regulator transcription factor n=1 Tax=Streptomyces xanthochromogenes TaxID=67384 RepID=UPI0034330ABB